MIMATILRKQRIAKMDDCDLYFALQTESARMLEKKFRQVGPSVTMEQHFRRLLISEYCDICVDRDWK